MTGLFLIIIILIVCGAIGYYLFTGIFDLFIPNKEEKTSTFIDKSVHHHYHDNRSITYEGELHKPTDKLT